MPANIVKINNSPELEYIVNDSKMETLLKWLRKNGIQIVGTIKDKKISFNKTKPKNSI